MTSLDDLLTTRRTGDRPCLLMGILNVTPDSFYDGGEYVSSSRALERAAEIVQAGADVIDVGGESTRPGAKPVTEKDEKRRVLPVVESIREELDVPVSVDTSKASVAREALERGASMINDVTGLEDPELREVVAEFEVPVCIMHMQGTPRTMQEEPEYDDVVAEVRSYLEQRAEEAEAAGVNPERILVDPGIGFGKRLEHNRKLLENVFDLKESGYPVMIGHSRKSFIGDVLGRTVEDRLAATLGVSMELINRGADVLRVHDVRAHSDALKMNRWLNSGGDESWPKK